MRNEKPNTSKGFRVFLQIILLAGVYCFAARMSLFLAFEKTNASPVWPPSGIAAALKGGPVRSAKPPYPSAC